eukprot:s2511_g3.t1
MYTCNESWQCLTVLSATAKPSTPDESNLRRAVDVLLGAPSFLRELQRLSSRSMEAFSVTVGLMRQSYYDDACPSTVALQKQLMIASRLHDLAVSPFPKPSYVRILEEVRERLLQRDTLQPPGYLLEDRLCAVAMFLLMFEALAERVRLLEQAVLKQPEMWQLLGERLIPREDLPGQEVFDCVVFGNVLCEVPDQEEIFRHVDRLLKPGGRVYFSEHTLTSSATLRRLQHLASPFWLCHCNRDSISKLRQQSWVKELHSWKFGLYFPVNRWELGLAAAGEFYGRPTAVHVVAQMSKSLESTIAEDEAVPEAETLTPSPQALNGKSSPSSGVSSRWRSEKRRSHNPLTHLGFKRPVTWARGPLSEGKPLWGVPWCSGDAVHAAEMFAGMVRHRAVCGAGQGCYEELEFAMPPTGVPACASMCQHVGEQISPGLFRCQLLSGSEATLQVDEKWDQHVAGAASATAMNFNVEWTGGVIRLNIDVEKQGCLLLHPSATRGSFRVVELFGGLGGWSYSFEAFNQHPIAVVEHDRKVAEAFAKAHACDVINPDVFLERALSGKIQTTVVVLGCVSDPKIWMAFGVLNVNFGMASPPCQPWSGAGSECGLNSDDGRIFETVLKFSGRLMLRALMVENVPNIASHKDFTRLLAGAAIEGLTCHLDDVHSICRALPMYRNRWLATFVQSTVVFDPTVVQLASAVTLASEGFALPGPTMSEAECLHPSHVCVDRVKLKPSNEAMDCMSRSDMIPKWMSHKVDWTHETPVLNARTLAKHDKMCCIMARYCSQHMLPENHLITKGLQTMVFDDDGVIRYFCPWEVLSALGFPPCVCIAFDLQDAFQQVGNAISPVHAWIQLARTHVLLGHLSMFDNEVKISEVLRTILTKAIKLSAFQPEIELPFEVLKPVVEEIIDEDHAPPAKKLRQDAAPTLQITPTIAFQADGEQSTKFCTDLMQHEPVFMIDKTSTQVLQDFCKGGIVFLKHFQNHWMMMIHGAVDEGVSTLIQRALPHAKPEHFQLLQCRGIDVNWDQQITCAPPATVVFRPAPIVLTCLMPNGDVIRLEGDLTWTIRTALAFIATHIGCNFDSLRLMYGDVIAEPDDFIAEYSGLSFQVRFKACNPGYCFAPSDVSVTTPGMIPVHGGCVRFVAKHPASKLIRTICCTALVTFAKVVRALFNDLCTSGLSTAKVYQYIRMRLRDVPTEEVLSFKIAPECGPLPFKLPSGDQLSCQANDTLQDKVIWCSKHPFQKIARVACLPSDAPVDQLVSTLFPDLASAIPWRGTSEPKFHVSSTAVKDTPSFEVTWGKNATIKHPILVVCKTVDDGTCSSDKIAWPVRWIKTPFTTKAWTSRVDPSWTIAQLAGFACGRSSTCFSLTCHADGALLDPSSCIQDVHPDCVLNLKMGPLCGGAKKAVDAIRSRVTKALEAHGVFKDACTDRAGAFMQKADIETIAKHESADDDEFWTAIKQEANRVHFRLVYRNELQQHKKNERKKPPAKTGKKPKDFTPKDDFVANASNIIIDIKHFKDDEDAIEMLEASRFGPDQKGLTVMSLEDANRHPVGTSISVDALAILVVGRQFHADDEPFTMPAMTNKGQPIVIQAALRQFGDRPVSFKAAIPTAKVENMASTVVEIHIYRSEVGSWKECSVPLHYLGVHISAVRGSSLIATWAMKTWGSSRQPAPFSEAQCWHGYVRVADDILDQVLARSGQSGIYVSARDEHKRHDDRFAVIALPNCSLQEAQKKAASFERTLGIVRLRDQFGIRCRREHTAVLRAALLPESAFVATEGIKADEALWILKNVPPAVGKDGLQDALTQSGWEAQPVRAQGQNRWLVASKLEPATKHFCINGSFVIVEPIKRQRENNAVTITAKQVKVDTVMNTSNGSMQIASSTRIQEVKAEISDQMEQKMQAANDRIAQLASTLEKMQAEQSLKEQETRSELAMVRTEQAFAKQKIAEVEASVVQSGQTVIQTMQAMMSQMQNSIETSMKQMLQGHATEDGKRHKPDQPDRNDSFATKG